MSVCVWKVRELKVSGSTNKVRVIKKARQEEREREKLRDTQRERN